MGGASQRQLFLVHFTVLHGSHLFSYMQIMICSSLREVLGSVWLYHNWQMAALSPPKFGPATSFTLQMHLPTRASAFSVRLVLYGLFSVK